MNSPFANIFLALQDRIQKNVPGIVHTDQELGQLKNARPSVAWPCVLIDFEDFSFDDLSEHVQTARGTVVLRLGFAPYGASSSATPSKNTQQALAYYDIEWAMHRVIHGWSPIDDAGSLCRTSVTTQKRTDNYRVREIRYSLAFEDYSTKRSLQLAPAEVVVTEEIL